ncbi:MAG: (d)CMP kinase [Proteobacteria bacterium]|nr:(d)CMP kinase [Pseudomonadota bacterium]
MIIAVDGPSAAGKGTVARAIASRMGYHFLDTGSLYRMVGLAMLRAGKSGDDVSAAAGFAATLDPASVRDADLRNEDVAAMASKVAAIPDVRAALLEFQRRFARQKPGAVLDGRDIGTVVCPDADLKFFVTARADVRARRRFEELRGQGHKVSLEQVLADIEARDARDAARAVAPTVAAPDAIVIDTSDLDRHAVLARVMSLVRARN